MIIQYIGYVKKKNTGRNSTAVQWGDSRDAFDYLAAICAQLGQFTDLGFRI
jgi:hypothetical protein